jgi:hypothetical protein
MLFNSVGRLVGPWRYSMKHQFSSPCRKEVYSNFRILIRHPDIYLSSYFYSVERGVVITTVQTLPDSYSSTTTFPKQAVRVRRRQKFTFSHNQLNKKMRFDDTNFFGLHLERPRHTFEKIAVWKPDR